MNRAMRRALGSARHLPATDAAMVGGALTADDMRALAAATERAGADFRAAADAVASGDARGAPAGQLARMRFLTAYGELVLALDAIRPRIAAERG